MILAASVLSGCRTERSAEPAPAPARDIRTVVFHACEVQTKTAFGQGQDGIYPTLWTSNDSFVKLALNYTEAAEAAVIPADNYLSASFSAEIDAAGTSGPYTFFAVSPASAAKALSPSRKAWNISIPADQTPLDGSVDERAQILAAASQPSDAVPAEVDLHFCHLTAYGRMTFKNLALDGAVVDRIEITATTPLVGDWYWDNTGEGTLTDNGASSTITLRTSRTSDIWFACAPVDMSGQLAVFTVYTDKGAFQKVMEFPQGRQFKSGRIAVFGVDMTGIGPVGAGSDDFSLVTDASMLAVGDEIVIANADGTYALGAHVVASRRSYREAEPITTAGGIITNLGNAEILTLAAGAASGTWAISSADGYLCTVSQGNSVGVSNTISNTGSWDIKIDQSGATTVKAREGTNNNLLYNYNNGNPRFSCYGPNTSVDGPVAIYRKGTVTPGPIEEDSFTVNTAYGCYLQNLSRVYVPGKDQYGRQYSAEDVLTFTILESSTNEQLEITGYRKALVKGDEVIISVSWRKGLDPIVSRTYAVRVVKEEGPKVWLSDGKGNGFIIKK